MAVEDRALPGICPPGNVCTSSGCAAPWIPDRCSYADCRGPSRAVPTGRPCRIVSAAPGGARLVMTAADGKVTVRPGRGGDSGTVDAFEIVPWDKDGYVIKGRHTPDAPPPRRRGGRIEPVVRHLTVADGKLVFRTGPPSTVWSWRCGYLLTGETAVAYVPNSPDRYPDGYALALESEFNHEGSLYKVFTAEAA